MTSVPMTLVGEPTHGSGEWVWEFVCECGLAVTMRIPDGESPCVKVRHGRTGEAYREFSNEEWSGRYSSPMSDWVASIHQYEQRKWRDDLR